MKELGVPFNNLSLYNASMRKGLEDKLFFLEYLPEDNYTFVDFGCADGSVISALCAMYPNKKGLNAYIGYDISFDMISLSVELTVHGEPKIKLFYIQAHA